MRKERIIILCIAAASLAATRANVHNRVPRLQSGIWLMADAKYDVLEIGNAIFDVLVRTDEKFLADHGMTKGGMALIDEARAASIYRDMGPATEISGGSAAIVQQSIRLPRLG